MPEQAKIEGCPFCGGPCLTSDEGDDMGAFSRVECSHGYDTWPNCNYVGGERTTEAEAIAAHNKVALAARLFPEALRTAKLLRGALDQILLESRHILFTEKDRARAEEAAAAFDTLLAEAQGVADGE